MVNIRTPAFIIQIVSESYGFFKACEHRGKNKSMLLICGDSQMSEVGNQDIYYILQCGLSYIVAV